MLNPKRAHYILILVNPFIPSALPSLASERSSMIGSGWIGGVLWCSISQSSVSAMTSSDRCTIRVIMFLYCVS